LPPGYGPGSNFTVNNFLWGGKRRNQNQTKWNGIKNLELRPREEFQSLKPKTGIANKYKIKRAQSVHGKMKALRHVGKNERSQEVKNGAPTP
jgi:hypothetical protein